MAATKEDRPPVQVTGESERRILNSASAFRCTCTCNLSLSLLTAPDQAHNLSCFISQGLVIEALKLAAGHAAVLQASFPNNEHTSPNTPII